jgi:hypothetical protein
MTQDIPLCDYLSMGCLMLLVQTFGSRPWRFNLFYCPKEFDVRLLIWIDVNHINDFAVYWIMVLNSK